MNPNDLKPCTCCMADQKKAGKPPRLRERVYSDDEPIFLCPFCDGDALAMARDLESTNAGE